MIFEKKYRLLVKKVGRFVINHLEEQFEILTNKILFRLEPDDCKRKVFVRT
jgi:hypothetical protein